jgi:hypothetical protein
MQIKWAGPSGRGPETANGYRLTADGTIMAG